MRIPLIVTAATLAGLYLVRDKKNPKGVPILTASPTLPEGASATRYRLAANADLYTLPGGMAVRGSLRQGTEVRAVETDGAYTHVYAEGNPPAEGWVLSALVAPAQAPIIFVPKAPTVDDLLKGKT